MIKYSGGKIIMDNKTLQALIMARDLLNGIIDHEEQSEATSGQETQLTERQQYYLSMQNTVTNPCNVCGNIKKPTTEHNGQYYCERCKIESAETDETKYKLCFTCGKRLPGFYRLDDMNPDICERCEEMRNE